MSLLKEDINGFNMAQKFRIRWVGVRDYKVPQKVPVRKSEENDFEEQGEKLHSRQEADRIIDKYKKK